jgi:type IV secretion system protein VirB8
MRNDLERVRWDAPANTNPPSALDARANEFSLAEAWAEETVDEARKSRNFAWVIALILIVICGAQAAAIAIMLPLKQIEPYTILVDKTTGYMEMVRGVKPGDLPQDQAVVEALLAQYVLAREAFDPADLKERYRQVALWSSGDAQSDYVASYQSGGAMTATPAGTRVAVAIKKVEILSRSAARVHFATSTRDPTGAETIRDWQSTIGFQFSGAPMRQEDRLINPLGFQALSYRRDGETPPPAPAAIAPPTPARSPTPELAPAPKLNPVQIAPPKPVEP